MTSTGVGLWALESVPQRLRQDGRETSGAAVSQLGENSLQRGFDSYTTAWSEVSSVDSLRKTVPTR